ncbi:hypothetical protein BH20ACI1_BH20ACI1_22690 [soil metagenome]
MAQIIVENQICKACGTDVRKGALFCYHCGGSVAPEIAAPKADKVVDENQVLAKENNAENGNKLNNKQEDESASIKEITEKPIPKPEIQPEKNLKSAASLRKKSKIVPKKKVEIIWEEHENAPNVWFVLAAILLTIFAIGVMWMALYF